MLIFSATGMTTNKPNILSKLLPLNAAITGLLIILSLTIIFHLFVLGGIIPFEIVWGGNIPDEASLWMMETISIAINCIMLLFVLAYAGAIKIKMGTTVAKIGFWIMFLIFLLNSLGNLLAKDTLETYIFTPITLLLSLFCFRIAAFGTSKK